MIDIFIVCFSLLAIGGYFFLKFIFVRLFSPFERLTFLFRLQILVGILLAGSLIMIAFLGVIKPLTMLVMLIFTQIIFHGMVILYTLTVFSYIESSITIKLFSLIGQKDRTRQELRQIYSKRHIVHRRLDRFLMINVIEKNAMLFQKTSRLTLFSVREWFILFMNKIFPYEAK